MKSNRILQLALLIIVIVSVSVGGFLYFANSSEAKRQSELTDEINKNQATINKSVAEKAAKEKEAAALNSELAAAQASLNQTDFRSSAESIEYDRILFAIADNTKLQLANLSATASMDKKENNTVYQVTTFSITVEGKTPEYIFASTIDSTSYINTTVDSVLAFITEVATGSDFDTTFIRSVDISAPEPMTTVEIESFLEGIHGMVEAELTAEIDLLTEAITNENPDLADEELQALIDTEVANLVEQTTSAKTPPEKQALMERGGLGKPSATITIEIWTHKGA